MENIQKLLKPKVKEFDINLSIYSHPEIIDISYDLLTLKITLEFENKWVYVIFKNVIGFRVLDEGNLLGFWDEDVRTSGWIWKVESGGWFELEKLRSGFLAQNHGDSHNEFLILGINDCVSIIAESNPIIIDAK